ncbi:MAG: TonB-dependent receptor domain-containing protein [Chitinispirillaceae bacterium]
MTLLSTASEDPLKREVTICPSFDIPNLNRFHGVVRGAPQATVGYTINGCPLLIPAYGSGLNSLTSQSVYQNSQMDFVNVRFHQFQGSPFFFDGYRSWFAGSRGLSVGVNELSDSLEYGFSAGPVVSISNHMVDSIPHLSVRAGNTDIGCNFSVPAGQTIGLNGSASYGYNASSIADYMDPYTFSGDFSYENPFYVNYSLFTHCMVSPRFTVGGHVSGAHERLKIDDNKEHVESEHEFSASRAYSMTHGGLSIGANLSERLGSKTTLSIGYNASDYKASGLNRGGGNLGNFDFMEKVTLEIQSNVHLAGGINLRKHFGSYNEEVTAGNGTIRGDTLEESRESFGLFSGLYIRFLESIMVDAGLRYDTYSHLQSGYGAIFAISPHARIMDSTGGDLGYRLGCTVNFANRSILSISSGTFNQSPTLHELYWADDLRSIKSVRHEISWKGFLRESALSYTLEAYGRQMWDLPQHIEPDESYESDLVKSTGRLRSHGVELSLSVTPFEMLSLIGSYALSKDEQYDHESAKWVRSISDRRHKLSTYLSANFPCNLAIGAGMLFCSGAPYTPVIGRIENEQLNNFESSYAEPYSSEQKPYVNLSARIGYEHGFGPLNAGVYLEGTHLLQKKPDEAMYSEMYGKINTAPANIDKRQFRFGMEVGF